MTFYDPVAETIQRHGLLEPGDSILVAVSGGPDSTALLLLLAEMNQRDDRGWRLHVGHLNHGIRPGEAEEDEAFVRGLAEQLGLEFTSDRVDVPALAKESGESLEEAARGARYEFLERAAREVGANKIAAGHTVDDNVETVLHRILRGTGLEGLRGIPPLRPTGPDRTIYVVRPLLEVGREQVLDYLAAQGVEAREDSTNAAREHLRNRIRHDLLPLLEQEYNPQIRRALLQLREMAASVSRYLNDRADWLLDRLHLRSDSPGYWLDAARLEREPAALQALVWRKAVRRATGKPPGMTYAHTEALIGLLQKTGSSKEIELPGGVRVRREYDRVQIFREGDERTTGEEAPVAPPPVEPRRSEPRPRRGAPAMGPPDGESFFRVLEVPGTTRIPGGKIISAELRAGGAEFLQEFLAGKDESSETVDFDRLSGRLVVRTREEGDRFQPLGSDGGKKLQDFFVDEKVPEPERDRVLIVATDEHPVWIVGHRIDDRVKVTDETQALLVLRIQDEPEPRRDRMRHGRRGRGRR